MAEILRKFVNLKKFHPDQVIAENLLIFQIPSKLYL